MIAAFGFSEWRMRDLVGEDCDQFAILFYTYSVGAHF